MQRPTPLTPLGIESQIFSFQTFSPVVANVAGIPGTQKSSDIFHHLPKINLSKIAHKYFPHSRGGVAFIIPEALP
jgi:hypothetical protein